MADEMDFLGKLLVTQLTAKRHFTRVLDHVNAKACLRRKHSLTLMTTNLLFSIVLTGKVNGHVLLDIELFVTEWTRPCLDLSAAR